MQSTQLRVALYEPRIPQNTGNIARTCAAYGAELNLIEPLGFQVNDKYLKRAGLDYWKFVNLRVHSNFLNFKNYIGDHKLLAFSKFSNNKLGEMKLQPNSVLLFGREDTGLPDEIKDVCDDVICIPMINCADSSGDNGVRSLNLSVACGIAMYAYGTSQKLW